MAVISSRKGKVERREDFGAGLIEGGWVYRATWPAVEQVFESGDA